jgi:hypothetical protein
MKFTFATVSVRRLEMTAVFSTKNSDIKLVSMPLLVPRVLEISTSTQYEICQRNYEGDKQMFSLKSHLRHASQTTRLHRCKIIHVQSVWPIST